MRIGANKKLKHLNKADRAVAGISASFNINQMPTIQVEENRICRAGATRPT